MLRFVADNFWLIPFGVFGIVSFAIVGWSVRRRHAAGSPIRVPGLATAVTSGIILGAAVAFANQAIAIAVGVPSAREGFLLDYVLVPFLYVGSLGFLAVLDVCAVWPHRPGDRAGAVGRGLLGVFLLVGGGRAIVGTAYGAVDSAVTAESNAAQQALQRTVDARATAVSMTVDVIDAEFAGPANGRFVSDLTVDVRVRSTSDIELLADGSGLADTWIHLGPPDTMGVQPEPGLEIPANLPA